MALTDLGLESLGSKLNDAVSNSSSSGNGSESSAAIGTAIYKTLSGWLTGSVFPILMTILIFVTVLFVFYGSFLYFTAYGDENKAQQAKKTITFAVVGFIIAIVAFSISTYVQRILITKKYETDSSTTQVNQSTPSNASSNTLPSSSLNTK
jgi:hypothetical protein